MRAPPATALPSGGSGSREGSAGICSTIAGSSPGHRHSLSLRESEMLFGELLPVGGFSTRGKTIVDVGSRLGNNMAVAAALTSASRVIGIEVDPFFARICADHVLGRHGGTLFADRGVSVELLVGDALSQHSAALRAADVVVFFKCIPPPLAAHVGGA